MLRVFKNIFFTPLFFGGIGLIFSFFLVGYLFPLWKEIGQFSLMVFTVVVLIDTLLLFIGKRKVTAKRFTPERFSNGDEHTIRLYIENRYPFAVKLSLIDELPVQFQVRDAEQKVKCKSENSLTVSYQLRPVTRGEYHFGVLNIYASSFIGLVKRRFQTASEQMVPCYPGFLQLKKYDLKAISNQLQEFGLKKIRRIGHSMEFEQIKEYVPGDDFRSINWKATAKKGDWMINHYQDERSQQVYNIIDMGRGMKMPFEGMSLVDYAVNAALILSNVVMLKHDKAGIATFSKNFEQFLPANRRSGYMQQILEQLYRLNTDHQESNFEQLAVRLKRLVPQRSLLIIYTNFETLPALRRQLPYLRRLANQHLVLVVFFENTELSEVLNTPAGKLEQVYVKATAEKFALEKKQIVKELQRHGIHSLLTPPANLTLNTINKYLEFKSRGMI